MYVPMYVRMYVRMYVCPLTAEDALEASVDDKVASVGRGLREPLTDVVECVFVDTCRDRHT